MNTASDYESLQHGACVRVAFGPTQKSPFSRGAARVRRRTVIFMTPCGLKPKGADTGTRSLSSFLITLFSIRPSAPRRAAATTVARTSRRRHRDEPTPCPCDRPIVCPQQQTVRVGPSVFIFARVRLDDLETLVVPRPFWTESPLALLTELARSLLATSFTLVAFRPVPRPENSIYTSSTLCVLGGATVSHVPSRDER